MTTRKPKVLFAWELGANFGHAANVAEVAAGLGDRAEVAVAAKAPENFRRIAPTLDVTLLAAPAGRVRAATAPADHGVNFADDLRHVGWSDARDLAALVEAWQALFRLTEPDLVAAQAAPTAVLAARALGLKTALFGYGYDCPPRTDPLPAFYHWSEDAGRDCAAREAAVTATANAALADRGAAPIENFAALLKDCAYLLASFPEIDGYAPRNRFEPDPPRYFGQLTKTDAGDPVDWRADASQRLFAYLQPAHGNAKLALDALKTLPPSWDIVVVAPGMPAEIARAYAKPYLRVLDRPARLDRLLKDCDVGLTHGASGTAAAFVAAGVPQICLPTHAEQLMTARALGTNGLAIGLAGKYSAANVREALLKAAGDASMRQRCDAVAKRLQRDDMLRPGRRIADALLRLL